jgi:hypothetical protein
MLELQAGPGLKLMMLQKADKPLIDKSIVASDPNFAPAVQQVGKYVHIFFFRPPLVLLQCALLFFGFCDRRLAVVSRVVSAYSP